MKLVTPAYIHTASSAYQNLHARKMERDFKMKIKFKNTHKASIPEPESLKHASVHEASRTNVHSCSKCEHTRTCIHFSGMMHQRLYEWRHRVTRPAAATRQQRTVSPQQCTPHAQVSSNIHATWTDNSFIQIAGPGWLT